MCAIHGISWSSETNIKKMISLSHHRGPDDNHYMIFDKISLGHNLLSIMDEARYSKQPICTEQITLVFNGEIYNYNDLKTKYSLDVNSNCDTEVLVKVLQKKGIDILSEIDGMFALAIYDKNSQTVTLSRDANGAKPLYYTFINHKLAFSSEIKSLLSLGIERKVDEIGFRLFFKQGYIPGEHTIYKNIYKLTPGQTKVYDLYQNKFIKNINLNDFEPSLENLWNEKDDLNDNIFKRMEMAVQQTQAGIRNKAILLSGGLDSSAILTHIKNKKTVRAYSSRFKFYGFAPHSRANEDSNLASKICKHLKMSHSNYAQSPYEYIKAFDKAIYALESPLQSKSLPAYYGTFKFISSKNNTVVISGDGGDEIFAGYKHHLHHNWETKLKALCVNNKQFINPELNMSHQDQLDYLYSWLPQKRISNMDNLTKFLYIERLNMLAEDFLTRSDKLGMAFSLEARFPILSNLVKDYVDSIPMKLKLGNESIYGMKPLLRNAYKGRINPEEVLRRGKTGWRSPTDEILIGRRSYPSREYSKPFRRLPFLTVKNPLREWVRDKLNDSQMMDIFEYTYLDIDSKYLCNYDWREQGNIGTKSQKELFSILAFSSWYKQFNMSF